MLVLNVNAQQEKISIAILPTKDAQDSSLSYPMMTNGLINAFSKNERFELVDRSRLDEIQQEKELQKTEDFLDNAKSIEQSKSLGAQYLLSSTFSNYVNDGDVCRFTLNLSIIDVETGKVVASDAIIPKSGGFGNQLLSGVANAYLGTKGALTPKDKALQKAIDNITPMIDEFVLKNFPVYFSIIEILKSSGDGTPQKLLVSGGSDFGVKKGATLKVVEIVSMNVNGKMIDRKKDIAELKVEKVEDGNFSICKVNKGGSEIKKGQNSGAKIQVTFK